MLKATMLRGILASLALAGAVLVSSQASAQTVICYSCPEEWADWGTQLRNVKQDLGITVPIDSKNSGQAMSQIIAEKENPVADFGYLGITFAIQAEKMGLTTPYKPKNFDDIPADLKSPDGHWFTIHAGAVGFFINKDALGNKPLPTSWKDLLKPEYKGLVGYYDPTSAFIGYVSGMAMNLALGGTLEDFTPAMDFYKAIKANQPIVVNQTSYARVLSGEIPILVDADFNANRGRYKDKANVVFVMPAEGSLPVPYAFVMTKNAPHLENAKKVADYLLSDKGQAGWANGFLRPVRPSAMSKEAADRLFPAVDYARLKKIDFGKFADAQKPFANRYLADVR